MNIFVFQRRGSVSNGNRARPTRAAEKQEREEIVHPFLYAGHACGVTEPRIGNRFPRWDPLGDACSPGTPPYVVAYEGQVERLSYETRNRRRTAILPVPSIVENEVRSLSARVLEIPSRTSKKLPRFTGPALPANAGGVTCL